MFPLVRQKVAGKPDTFLKGVHTDSFANTHLLTSRGATTQETPLTYREILSCMDLGSELEKPLSVCGTRLACSLQSFFFF